ncbi:MAG: DNA primase [Flavobacteriales bacterium]|nr:DNA primase [Flavobacteriales bacterium]
MISKSTIDKVFDTARIEEVVGDFVTLKQRGVNKIGLCPFHNEKTPSFTVSTAKGIYKCFGCGEGGNSVKFVMEHEKYSYPEALRYLAEKYNIEIEEDAYSEEDSQIRSERESQYVLLSHAQKYFSDILKNNDEGKAIGLSYFKERGYNEESIELFQLGYGLESWDAFTKDALKKGYKIDYLEKTGLTIVKEDKHYDRFRGRVMFPIHNFSGKVIGFGGRVLKKDVKAAKYVNSPESEVYEKRRVLYGIYYSKKEIVAKDNCYLVEGYTDVITLYQSGIQNVVSSSGTSLTVDQIRLIKRITNNITILFDGDAAGIKASFRGIDLILQEGLNVRIVLFPEGEDPDSYARKVSQDELHDFLKENSKDFIAFKTGLLLEDVASDPVKKSALIREILESVAVIPDPISRSTFLHECGRTMDISEQILIAELNKIRRKNVEQFRRGGGDFRQEPVEVNINEYKSGFPAASETAKGTTVSVEPQERDVMRFLLNYGDAKIDLEEKKVDPKGKEESKEEGAFTVEQFIVHEIAGDGLKFENEVYGKIFTEYENAVKGKKTLDQQFFLQHEDTDVAELSVDLVFSAHALSKNWEERHQIYVATEEMTLRKAVERTVYSLKMSKVKRMIAENREKIKTSEDDNSRGELLKEYSGLLEAKKYISKVLGRVVS